MIKPGTLLQSRYRVDRQIGQGGMGAVYVATDVRFTSTVAVKETFFDDPTLRKAFEREAHLLNRLRHGALPKVSDHFTEGDGQFLVMEFIEGRDLSEMLEERRGAFPAAEVLGWADDLLDALDYLHTHDPQIVHRDIKPQNLKLTPRGQIILLDFGLAKGSGSQTRASMTASVYGYSRNYAPLEQIQGAGTDPRSDLYSLAATLYHLLTGAAPVDALTRATATVNNQPDPLRPANQVNPQVPEAVGRLLQRAMSQKANLRPQTAAEMRAALAQVSKSLPAAPAHPTHASAVERTLVETPAHTFDAARHDSAAGRTLRDTTQARREQTARGETTVVEGTRVAPQRAFRPYNAADSQTRVAEAPARKSHGRVIALALALAFVCAAVPFVASRRSEPEGANPQLQTSTPTDSATAEQGGTQPSTQSGGGNAGPLSGAQNTSAGSQSGATRTSWSSSGAGEQSGAGGTSASAQPGAGGSASEQSARPASDLGASGGDGGLSIQRPVGAAPAQNNAAALYDAQQAEELRRRREEAARPRPVEQQQYRPPPPPPPGGGHPFPPPPGGGPPPPRRPPMP